MRVLAFRHVPFEGVGLIRAGIWNRERSGSIMPICMTEGAAMPDVAGYDGLIFLGGPCRSTTISDYLRSEMDAFAQEVPRGRPVLGICLGAQLIARGARCGGAAQSGEGDRLVRDRGLPRRAAGDPLSGKCRAGNGLPLARGDFRPAAGRGTAGEFGALPQPGLRLGDRVYGLQFHLEVTPDMIADWCVQDANCGDMREVEADIDPCFGAQRMIQISTRVFGNWGRMLQGR